MDVKTTISVLQKALYHPSLFYIPYALFPDLSEESLIELEAMSFFNSLSTISETGQGSTFKSIHRFTILTKSTVLRQNIVQLLELKAQVQVTTFKLILEDYWSTAKLWEHIYDWLKDHVAQDVPTINSSTAKLFTVQSEAMKDHLSQLEHHFQFASQVQPMDRNVFLEQNKSLIPFDQKTVKHIFNNADDSTPSNSASTTQKKPRKKIILPNVEDVDAYLLERVFNVDGEKHVK